MIENDKDTQAGERDSFAHPPETYCLPDCSPGCDSGCELRRRNNARLVPQDAQDGEWFLGAPWRIAGYAGEHDESGAHIVDVHGKTIAKTYGGLRAASSQQEWARYRAVAELIASAPALTARVKELEERLACKAPVIQYDPDCDHESDPIEKAFYIVANNMLKHLQTGKHWDCQDTCWLEDLEQARAIIQAQIAARVKELEQERDSWQRQAGAEADALFVAVDRAEAAEARAKRLEQALREIVADMEAHHWSDHPSLVIARAALKEARSA